MAPTVEYKKMSKTVEKLEWGRYAEYLNFKFVFDFDTLDKLEHRHLLGVIATLSKSMLVAAAAAYFSAKIALLQWASISLVVMVIQGLTVLNTPSYETNSMKAANTLFSIAFGCTIASILNNCIGMPTWITAAGLVKVAALTRGFSYGCISLTNHYEKFMKVFTENAVNLSSAALATKMTENAEEPPESRVILYLRTLFFSALAYVAAEYLVFFVFGMEVSSMVNGAVFFSSIYLLYFCHSQFIIAKSSFYDRHVYTQVTEMFIETIAMCYYLPKSLFFALN